MRDHSELGGEETPIDPERLAALDERVGRLEVAVRCQSDALTGLSLAVMALRDRLSCDGGNGRRRSVAG